MSPRDLLKPDLLSGVIVFTAILAITITLFAMAVVALRMPGT